MEYCKGKSCFTVVHQGIIDREILVQWHFLVLLQVIPLGLRRQAEITKLGVSCDFTFFILNKPFEMIGTYEDQRQKLAAY